MEAMKDTHYFTVSEIIVTIMHVDLQEFITHKSKQWLKKFVKQKLDS